MDKIKKTTCQNCSSKNTRKFGIQKNKLQTHQKYFCNDCQKTFILNKITYEIKNPPHTAEDFSFYYLMTTLLSMFLVVFVAVVVMILIHHVVTKVKSTRLPSFIVIRNQTNIKEFLCFFKRIYQTPTSSI